MPDLFEGFRWREVVAVLAAMVFFVVVIINAYRDLDAITREQDTLLRQRVRALEVEQAKLWCSVNPETCHALEKR